MLRKSRWVVVAAVMLAVMFTTSAAYAWVVIVPNVGVSQAKLGANDAANARILGKGYKYGIDKDYATRTYYWCWGKPSGGVYPLEMNSNSSHKTIAFTVSTNAYKTAKGITIGSTESQVRGAYGKALTKAAGSTTVRYTMHAHPTSKLTYYTDFWCRRGKVFRIVVRAS